MFVEAFIMFGMFFSDVLPVGSAAPDFEAKDQDGKSVSLAALRGKNVVLVFYPMDETPGCTAQLCEMRDRWPDIQKKNTVVLGVNPGSAEKHRKFKENRNYQFPLLVDEKQRIAKLYNSDGWFVPKRTVYLVGPDGKIKFAERGSPTPQTVLRAAQ